MKPNSNPLAPPLAPLTERDRSMSIRRLTLTTATAVLCVWASTLALSGATAFGAFTHRYLSSFGSFTDIAAVTVDQSTGDVYVLDTGKGGGSLYKFNAAGEPAEFSVTKTNVIEGVGGRTTERNALSVEVAVDSSAGPAQGDIYIATGEALEIYGADGASLGTLSEVHACGVAVDPAGNLYLGVGNRVDKYTPSANPVTSSDYVADLQIEETGRNDLFSLDGDTCGVAADSEGDVYINNLSPQQEHGVFEGVTARLPALQFGLSSPTGSYVDMRGGALAVEAASGDVYVDGSRGVVQYDSAGRELGRFGAEGTGALSASYGVAVDNATGDVYAANGTSGSIELFGPGVVLPDASTGDASGMTAAGGATLYGSVNPRGLPVSSCRFEYGTGLTYGHFAPCEPDPGSGSGPVAVSANVSGLASGQLYQYRLLASDANGGTPGINRMFSVPAAADACPNAQIRAEQSSSYLPDCRAYELVSPVEKGTGGANVAAAGNGETQSALNGEAIKYFSGTAFGDTEGIEGKGVEYVSQRSAAGWTTHGITPKMGALAYELYAGPEYEAFSPDLSKGVFLSYKPLTSGDPNVEHDANLYLRTDLLAPPPGNYELLSNSVSPLPSQPEVPGTPEVTFVDGSSDFSHILFESDHDLTTETSGLETSVPKLYEWINGTLKLGGILPDGTAAAESTRGRDAEYSGLNSMASDGSRFVFSGPPFHEIQAHSAGNLYLRSTEPGAASTIQLNTSERSTPDPGGPQPAIFAGATPDESKIFFFSSEMLTDGTTSGGLYRYDVNAPAGQHLTLIVPKITEIPLDGISEDGSYVYFVSNAALLPGQPEIAAEEALYVWHEGTVRFVTEISYYDYRWGRGRVGNTYNPFRISSDGHYVAFESHLESTARQAGASIRVSSEKDSKCVGSKFVCETTCWPTNTCGQIFVYSYPTNSIVCASCSPSGADPSSRGTFVSEFDSEVSAPQTQYQTRAISANGRYVFFDTADALVPQDTNNQRDVYEYDTETGQVHLISGGTCACASTFVDASADGSNVFFTTHQQLVRADVDTQGDMYDARINGGIPSQNTPPRAPCEGEDCQGPAQGAPAFSLPASGTFAGAGNTAPAVKPAVKQLKKKAKPQRHKRKQSKRGKQHEQHKRKTAKRSIRHASHRAGR
jgi:hypothetical protein